MKYKVISKIDVGDGYLYNSAGVKFSMQALAPKPGDIINGEISEVFIFGRKQRGIGVEISTGPSERDERTEIFIPESKLKQVPDTEQPGLSGISWAGVLTKRKTWVIVGLIGLIIYVYKKIKD